MDKKDTKNPRMSLHFDTSDEDQMLCYDFLNKHPKQKTKIVTLIVKDFIERYNIRDISQQEMRDFIRFFSSIKHAVERTSAGMVQISSSSFFAASEPAQTKAALPVPEDASEQSVTENKEPTASKEEMARMNAALAMFFNDEE